VLVAGFPAGSFAANCYLVAPGPGAECLIIDPGQDAERGIEELLARYRLRPAAVLLTHGHIDHMWSVAPVCGARDIPAYIHPADRALLTDPARGFSLMAGQQLFGDITFTEPDDVRELAAGMTLELAGVRVTVDYAPGHTPGSVTFTLPPGTAGGGDTAGSAQAGPAHDPDAGDAWAGILFTGDLLFAGSIGRTDLPGGDYETILESLARVCLTRADETVVLPGHGPQTTIGAERQSNPFLAGLAPSAGPARGL